MDGKGRVERMNYQDATFAFFDKPQFPYNVGSVGIYQGEIPFEAYAAHVERRIGRASRYRQRIVPVPFNLHFPTWHYDPDFDIRNHVKRAVLPPPGDDEQLSRFAGEFFAEPLDRSKPLWEFRLVEGLSGGRTAHVAKVHHCLVDGVGGVELLGAILDLEPAPPESPGDQASEPPAPIPGATERFVDAVFDRAQAQLDLAEAFTLALLQPQKAAGWVRSIAGSVGAALPHFGLASKRTPWSTRLTNPSRTAWQRVPFAEVRAVKSELGGTVNDVVLTILAGGLRRYLQFHGYETDGLVVRVLIPVNVRTDEEEHSLGNRVSFMLAGLPMGEADPIARFQAIHHSVTALKEADQAGGVEKLFRALSVTPPPVHRLLGARMSMPNFLADMVCTNVPGPLAPLYCMGRQMIDHYAWVPIGWQMGLGAAIMSYNEGLYFSLTADRTVMADLERLAGFLGESFEELRDAAPSSGRVPTELRTDVRAPAGDGLRTVEVAPEPSVRNGLMLERAEADQE
jgi:WS/DGAT/MGAT family acyltransferase